MNSFIYPTPGGEPLKISGVSNFPVNPPDGTMVVDISVTPHVIYVYNASTTSYEVN